MLNTLNGREVVCCYMTTHCSHTFKEHEPQ